MKDDSDEARERYRTGYDNISWSNTPRPEYQGGVRPIAGLPPNVLFVMATGPEPENIVIVVSPERKADDDSDH